MPFQHYLTVLFLAAGNCYKFRCNEILLNLIAVKWELNNLLGWSHKDKSTGLPIHCAVYFHTLCRSGCCPTVPLFYTWDYLLLQFSKPFYLFYCVYFWAPHYKTGWGAGVSPEKDNWAGEGSGSGAQVLWGTAGESVLVQPGEKESHESVCNYQRKVQQGGGKFLLPGERGSSPKDMIRENALMLCQRRLNSGIRKNVHHWWGCQAL